MTAGLDRGAAGGGGGEKIAAMPQLTLHLNGTPRVSTADGRDHALERRAAALCALAALEPGVARERVASWLWPDSPDPRRNLRQQLLRFRQQFGRPLLAGEAALALAEGVQVAPGDGVLLQDLDFADCDAFADWLALQRRRAEAGLDATRRDAVARAEAAGDLDAALDAANRWHAADPGHEDAAAALMRVHYLRGEAAAGLAVHRRLADTLAQRGGGPPPAALEELAAALRRGQPAALAVPHAAALPLTLKRPPRLAGRAAEQAAARAAWAAGRAVLLEGEAGLGKSRLTAELLADPATAPHCVGSGRPGDDGAPYATLARWLQPLLADAPPLDAADRATLAQLTGGAGTGGPAMTPAAAARAVAALLAARGIRTAVLDDLHFADRATLELVAGLVADESPLRWLFAQRAAEATEAGRTLRDGLADQRRLDIVTLAPLDAGAAAELIDSLAVPGLAASSLAPALVRHTGGNPLYLLETLRQGLVDGSLRRGELPRPAQVGALIERRLQRLSPEALSLARVAAVAGVDFRLELAEAALDQRAVQLASAWQELQDAQVLRDEAFAHDLVADAALKTVPAVIARRLHAQCAAWLAEHGGEPARVAGHWAAGGEPLRAGEAYMQAAVRAERASRMEEERVLYDRAAACFAAAGRPERRFEALCLRVRALTDTDFGDAGLAEAEALVGLAADDAQRLQALLQWVGLLTERSQCERAVEVGREALALARRRDDRETQVRLACHLASAHSRLGAHDEALAVLRPLRDWVLSQPDPALVMLWHGDWASALGMTGQMAEAIAAYDTAIAAAGRANLPYARGMLVRNCAVTLRQSGRLDRALAMAREGQADSVQDSTDAAGLLIARLVLAREESEGGHYDSALQTLEVIAPKFDAAGTPFWAQAARMVLVQLWLHLGQPARAVALLRDEPEGVAPWLRADRALLQRELAAALGQPLPPPGTALAWVADDRARLPVMRVRGLFGAPPEHVIAEAGALRETLRARERLGAWQALEVRVAHAALATGQPALAAEAATRVMALFDDGIAPDALYRPEAWWTAHRAFAAAGREADAARALADGLRWVREVALPHVPPAFLDSFLHRNAVNRALFAAAR